MQGSSIKHLVCIKNLIFVNVGSNVTVSGRRCLYLVECVPEIPPSPLFLPPSPTCSTFAPSASRFDPWNPPSTVRLVEGTPGSTLLFSFLKNASKTSENITKHHELQQSTIINISLRNPTNFTPTSSRFTSFPK